MKINKISIWDVFKSFLMIVGICVLKSTFLKNVLADSLAELMSDMIIFWGTNHLVKIVWILPVIMNLFFISKRGYEGLLRFNTRYKNRNSFVLHIVFSILIESTLYNLFIVVSQLIILLLYMNISFTIPDAVKQILIIYILINILINFIIIYCALQFKNYTYSLLGAIIICSLFVVVVANYKPFQFMQSICTPNLMYMIIALIVVCILLIRRKYLNVDIGGLENDFRN